MNIVNRISRYTDDIDTLVMHGAGRCVVESCRPRQAMCVVGSARPPGRLCPVMDGAMRVVSDPPPGQWASIKLSLPINDSSTS